MYVFVNGRVPAVTIRYAVSEKYYIISISFMRQINPFFCFGIIFLIPCSLPPLSLSLSPPPFSVLPSNVRTYTKEYFYVAFMRLLGRHTQTRPKSPRAHTDDIRLPLIKHERRPPEPSASPQQIPNHPKLLAHSVRANLFFLPHSLPQRDGRTLNLIFGERWPFNPIILVVYGVTEPCY